MSLNSASADPTRQCQIAFGQTRHSRTRPVQRQFGYRCFFLRVPVHLLAGQRHGNWLFGLNRAALLSWHERDHGDGHSARTWIDRLLAEAGIAAPTQVWLHAFPRIFGYVFKPVSFWFCHRQDGALMAIVAEVNNTFGERHCYLLAHGNGEPIKAGAELSSEKAFHVSPFCAVQGSYRFRFMHAKQQVCMRVDHYDDIGPLLLTSLSGTLQTLNNRTTLHALLSYPLFTVAVIVRIHWQAVLLWLARVPLYRKPAAPEQFVTRGN